MRDFEERKAEVFRRSEKRMKERKRRRMHVLMACIPLVLCITLFSALFLPGNMKEAPRDPGATNAAMGELTENQSESHTCSIAKITVSGLGYSRSYTDVADILLISDQLASYSTNIPEINGPTNDGVVNESADDAEDADYRYGNVSGSVDTGYIISLVMHEGEKTEYSLAGNTLKNLTTEQESTLSQNQVNELKDLLGIPHS